MLSYAFGIVSEYIKSDLSEKLAEHLGLEKVKQLLSNKRKSTADSEAKSNKRIKTEENDQIIENKPFVSNTPKEKKVSAKERQMVKAASGTKSISSFFTKK